MCSYIYCIGKIEDFDYTTRLSFLGLSVFAKQNAHVCIEIFDFVNAHFSYYNCAYLPSEMHK